MPSKEESMFELDNVRFEFRIVDDDILQYFDLYFGLLVEFGFISDYFQSNILLLLVIEGFENLSK